MTLSCVIMLSNSGFGKRVALVQPYESGSGEYYDSLNYIAGLGK